MGAQLSSSPIWTSWPLSVPAFTGHVFPHGSFHYMFSNEDCLDHEGCFLHTHHTSLTTIGLMKVLERLGYPRAVITLQRTHLCGMHQVHFVNSQPTALPQLRPTRERTEWPALQDTKWTDGPLYNVDNPSFRADTSKVCTNFNSRDLQELLEASHTFLSTNFDNLTLPDFVKDAVCVPRRHQHYHRWLIYTDGSSQASMRRVVPEQADELGMPDTWAMLVLGEFLQWGWHYGRRPPWLVCSPCPLWHQWSELHLCHTDRSRSSRTRGADLGRYLASHPEHGNPNCYLLRLTDLWSTSIWAYGNWQPGSLVSHSSWYLSGTITWIGSSFSAPSREGTCRWSVQRIRWFDGKGWDDPELPSSAPGIGHETLEPCLATSLATFCIWMWATSVEGWCDADSKTTLTPALQGEHYPAAAGYQRASEHDSQSGNSQRDVPFQSSWWPCWQASVSLWTDAVFSHQRHGDPRKPCWCWNYHITSNLTPFWRPWPTTMWGGTLDQPCTAYRLHKDWQGHVLHLAQFSTSLSRSSQTSGACCSWSTRLLVFCRACTTLRPSNGRKATMVVSDTWDLDAVSGPEPHLLDDWCECSPWWSWQPRSLSKRTSEFWQHTTLARLPWTPWHVLAFYHLHPSRRSKHMDNTGWSTWTLHWLCCDPDDMALFMYLVTGLGHIWSSQHDWWP